MKSARLVLLLLLVSLYGHTQDIIKIFKAPNDSSTYLMGSEEYNNNFYVVGRLSKKKDIRPHGQQIIYKLNSNLQIVWFKKMNISGALFDITKDGNGNFIVCGEYADSVGRIFPYIAKLDSNANIIWHKIVGKMCPSYSVEARFYKVKKSNNNFIVIGAIVNSTDTLSAAAYIINTNGDSILLTSMNTHSTNSLNYTNHAADAIETGSKLIFTGSSGENGSIFVYDKLTNESKYFMYSDSLNEHFDIHVKKIYNVIIINDTINLLCDFYKYYFIPPNFPFYEVKTIGLLKVDSSFNYIGHIFLNDSVNNNYIVQLSWIHNIIDTPNREVYIGYNYDFERVDSTFSNSDFCLLKLNMMGNVQFRKKINYPGYQFMYKYLNTSGKKILISGYSIQNNKDYAGIVALVDTNNFVGISNISIFSKQITISPNPAKNSISFSTKEFDVENAQFVIYNSVGQLLIKEKINQNNINIESLTSGVYYISIITKDKVYQLKFIKQ